MCVCVYVSPPLDRQYMANDNGDQGPGQGVSLPCRGFPRRPHGATAAGSVVLCRDRQPLSERGCDVELGKLSGGFSVKGDTPSSYSDLGTPSPTELEAALPFL